jgi:hypothetical protein
MKRTACDSISCGAEYKVVEAGLGFVNIILLENKKNSALQFLRRRRRKN